MIHNPNRPPSPYHEDYGLPEELRSKAIEDSKHLGTKKAAQVHRVSLSAIYKWKRDYKSETYPS